MEHNANSIMKVRNTLEK